MFSAVLAARQARGYAGKIVWGKKVTRVATSYRLKIFHRHLFLKGKIRFCENIFSTKMYLLSVEN